MSTPKHRKPRKPHRTQENKDCGNVKYTEEELQKVYEEVAHLTRRGWTQVEIATKIGVSQKTISLYLKDIRRLWAENVTWEITEYVAEKLDQYREIRKEAWSAWERSKESYKRTVTEKGHKRTLTVKLGEGPKGRRETPATADENKLVVLKRVLTKEGRVPAVQFLQVVLETLEAERRLLGLDVLPRKNEVGDRSAQAGVSQYSVDWQKLVELAGTPMLAMDRLEAIEAEARMVEQTTGAKE